MCLSSFPKIQVCPQEGSVVTNRNSTVLQEPRVPWLLPSRLRMAPTTTHGPLGSALVSCQWPLSESGVSRILISCSKISHRYGGVLFWVGYNKYRVCALQWSGHYLRHSIPEPMVMAWGLFSWSRRTLLLRVRHRWPLF